MTNYTTLKDIYIGKICIAAGATLTSGAIALTEAQCNSLIASGKIEEAT